VLFDPGPDIAPGIHPSACIDPTAQIADDCAIGPFTIIGPDVVIEAGCRIAGHVSVARGARIGENCLILAGVRIETDAQIGNRVILHPNAVIGADGFSFVTEAPSSVERTRAALTDTNTPEPQNWVRVHSLGTVRLEDDVEIGSNSNVDRGTVRETVIGRGTKIDNQVQIGHNAIIGEDCMICSQVGVAGSAKIGNRVVLAGRVAVNDNIFVGDDVVAGGAAKLFTNVPAGRVVLGDPAIKITAQMESYKAFRRLPRLMRDVAALKKATAKPDDND
jgi:UDP-3-O-[3-hydroxymyristoyl] glucosamine N-acyltransferase